MTEKTPEVLRRASAILGEKGWCQGMLSDSDGRMCAMGALEAATSEYLPKPETSMGEAGYFERLDRRVDILSEAAVAMADVVGIPYMDETGLPGNPVPDWNDAADRTAEEVILTMKRAAQYIEERREGE